ncbi:uncharacterized protein [Nicotiana sylvestris]|uniref:Uncharacterized protein LOC104232629 n=1 Tax=Nicotiana sylvestris TaxID=4096 RepID=A0A1U7X020_NICSY|nr:PREDICTED: uncharacterized protein LOC104232629 [Nicotiana sylvestris]
MFLKTSISSTKKLFQKTLDSVKSFFAGGYQKLPKCPPCSPLLLCAGGADTNVNRSYTELEKYYTDFSTHWDCGKDKPKRKSKNKIISPSANISRQEDDVHQKIVRFTKVSPRKSNYQVLEKEREDHDSCQVLGSNDDLKRKKIMYEGKKKCQEISSPGDDLREERSYLVAQKLRELKMLEKNNEEHGRDIEEVLYYYSRLTCPTYVEIVDKFFMEMYSELFNQQATSFGYINHNMSLQRVNLY